MEEKKWKVENKIQKVQVKLKRYKHIEFGTYNVIDISDYTEEELLQEESFLSKVMLIEKARYTDNLNECLERIVQEINTKEKVYTKEQKELFVTIINLVLSTKLDKEEVEKLIKSLKGGEKPMLAVLEMLEEENKKIFRKGKKEAKLETAKKMLEEKTSIEFIKKVTGLTEKEINKLK